MDSAVPIENSKFVFRSVAISFLPINNSVHSLGGALGPRSPWIHYPWNLNSFEQKVGQLVHFNFSSLVAMFLPCTISHSPLAYVYLCIMPSPHGTKMPLNNSYSPLAYVFLYIMPFLHRSKIPQNSKGGETRRGHCSPGPLLGTSSHNIGSGKDGENLPQFSFNSW
jgi:hypothetical protein